nr:hypothetical protein [Tanacetum cinerariifolium]
QSAFVLGRRIIDNILITQELMHNYHRNRGLLGFGFQPIMVKWIMACVTSTSFSISLNGDILDFLREREIRVRIADNFRYHKHYEELQIINVCFADDLFIFARGDVDSAHTIMESLEEFKKSSGLVLRHASGYVPWSPAYIFEAFNRDCKVLVEKATNRIGDWKNKSLLFAGRLRFLKTQDLLRPWDVGIGTDPNQLRCVFCKLQPDSHEHLFFECSYSTCVWYEVHMLAGMDLVPYNLQDILSFLQPIAHRRTATSVIGQLVLAAYSYFIWLEHNNRLFKNVKRSEDELRDIIMVTIRLKLLTFRFKNTDMVRHLLF